jgi:ketosteroid isomerase-like protein
MRLAPPHLALLLLVVAAAAPASAGPEQDIQARHKGLVAAINKGDTKAMRGYYTPDYKATAQGQTVDLKRSLAIMEAFKKEGIKLTGVAKLSRIKVKGNTATALETADVTVALPNGQRETRKGQQAEQQWAKVGGVWKLKFERSLAK